MIDKALEFLVGELNNFLSARFPSHEKHVVLASLSAEGLSKVNDKIVVTLVNLEREGAASMSTAGARGEGGYQRVAPPLHLNLSVLVAASYENNYRQALALLSAVLGFFQGKQNFTAQNSAALPSELDRLGVDLVSLSLAELNHLWGNLGAKYLPSALYRVRMLTIQQGWSSEPVPEVRGGGARVGA